VINVLVTTNGDEDPNTRFSDRFVFETLPRIGDEIFVQSGQRRWNAKVNWVRHLAVPQNPDDWGGGETIVGCQTIEMFEIK
jgi:hypothetical protein